jgi:aminopeptidase N
MHRGPTHTAPPWGGTSPILVLILSSLVSAPARGQALPDPNRRDLHSFANPRQIRVTRVELDLTADFNAKQLHGSATLDVERATGVASKVPLILDTRDLTIESVDSSGRDGGWTKTRHTLGARDGVLGRPLSITLPAGTNRVRIAYRTAPTAGALQWLNPSQTAGGRSPFLYSQSQAIQARSWIPMQDSPAVRVTYSATIRTPPGLKALMAADHRQHDDAVFRFEMPQPIPPYLIALAIGELEFRELGPRTGVYAEPSILDKAAFEFAETEKMIEVVEQRFGPYRWGRYDLLVLPPSFPFGGMENPKLTFATPTVLAGDRSLVDLVAHELAHSWSGNLVTNATWRDFWLNEGFTTYLERRIIEAVYGPDRRAMADMLSLRELRAEVAELPRRDEILHIDLSDRDPDEAMTSVPYEKGARLLMAIEHAFGRDRFDEFLRRYFDRFAFQSITTADFESYLRESLFPLDPEAAKQINLHDWIHSAGLPRIVPEPRSDRLEAVERQARSWREGQIAASDIETKSWTTQEWLFFLRSLPETITPKRMAELDAAFRFTERENAEVAQQWLLIAVRNDYSPSNGRLESFLNAIGRRKYIVPLYAALAKTPSGRARARSIYGRSRALYHPITIDSLDRLLGPPESDP